MNTLSAESRLKRLKAEEHEDYYSITFKNGKVGYIDKEDLHFLEEYTWCANGRDYVLTTIKRSSNGSGGHVVLLHRYILNADKHQLVDHINHNTLDNRKKNLRICNAQQNSVNRMKQQTRLTSKYKGVHYNKLYNNYEVTLCVNRKNMHIGVFTNEYDAAKAYDMMSIFYCDTDFLVLNLLNENYAKKEDIYTEYTEWKADLDKKRSLITSDKFKSKDFPSLTDPYGNVYPPGNNIISFSKEHNLNSSSISKLIRGKYKQHHGWVITNLGE